MVKNTSFDLGEHFNSFGEMIGEEEAKLMTLRTALDEGEASGPAVPFDFEAFIAGKRKHRRER